jgi:hypothetical protein
MPACAVCGRNATILKATEGGAVCLACGEPALAVVLAGIFRTLGVARPEILPSGWYLDVWDCRGTLKPGESLLGYGSTYDLPPGWRWAETGWFRFPCPPGVRPRYAAVRRALAEALDRAGGAINTSGWYPVPQDLMDRLSRAVPGIEDLPELLEEKP